MAWTRSMTSNQKTSRPWSDLNPDLLLLVMMKLGFVDYYSFLGVCKSWRLLACSNKKKFMESRPPMSITISSDSNEKVCFLEYSEGSKFKIDLPSFAGGACVGLTYGYLIFYKRTTRDFWLVNPITRHQLHFPNFPLIYHPSFERQEVKAVLVFSPSISEWVLVVLLRFSSQIWFSEESTGEWDDVSCSTLHVTDLCAFKGKIYSLSFKNHSDLCLCELRRNPEPKLLLVNLKNSLKHAYFPQLVSSGENIYVMDRTPEDHYRFQELDFDEMKWVLREKRVGESAAFLSNFKHGVVEKQHLSGIHGQGLLLGHNMGEMLKLLQLRRTSFFTTHMWYLTHEFLNVDRLDE